MYTKLWRRQKARFTRARDTGRSERKIIHTRVRRETIGPTAVDFGSFRMYGSTKLVNVPTKGRVATALYCLRARSFHPTDRLRPNRTPRTTPVVPGRPRSKTPVRVINNFCGNRELSATVEKKKKGKKFIALLRNYRCHARAAAPGTWRQNIAYRKHPGDYWDLNA